MYIQNSFACTFIIDAQVLFHYYRYIDESQRIKWFVYLTNWGFLVFNIAQLVNAITATVAYVSNGKPMTYTIIQQEV